MALIDKLTAIADAIRGKTGKTEEMTLDQMATEIAGIETGGGEDTLLARLTNTLTEYTNEYITEIPAYAFYACTGLTDVSLPSVTSIKGYAFQRCTGITEVTDKQFPAVTSAGDYAFQGCTGITEVSLTNITALHNQGFKGCTSLQTVTLPSILTIGGTWSGDADVFTECTSLTSVYIPKATLIGFQAFYGCKALTEVDLPEATKVVSNAFKNCGLHKITFPKLETLGATSLFGCWGLKTLDLPSTITTLGKQILYYTHITSLIIRNTSAVCVLEGTLQGGGQGDSTYIYVPAALLSEYQTATNWSNYTDWFRALEDYTVDGTTTGELDWDLVAGVQEKADVNAVIGGVDINTGLPKETTARILTDYISVTPGTAITIMSDPDYYIKAWEYTDTGEFIKDSYIGNLTNSTISGTLDTSAASIRVLFKKADASDFTVVEVNATSLIIGETRYNLVCVDSIEETSS